MDLNERRTFCKTRLYKGREKLVLNESAVFEVSKEKWTIKWDGINMSVLNKEQTLANVSETSVFLHDTIHELYQFPIQLIEQMLDNQRK